MNPELKQKWVQALRSGKYEQGQCTLRTKSDTFCCLGVLCDVFDSTQWIEADDGVSYYDYISSGFSGDLPPDVMRAASIDDNATRRLVDMNDIEDATFAEIADYIEAEL